MSILEEICMTIKSDVDSILLGHLKEDSRIKTNHALECRLLEYFANAKGHGFISKIPKVSVEVESSGDLIVRLYDQDTGEKIDALDKLVSPFAKYGDPEGGGL